MKKTLLVIGASLVISLGNYAFAQGGKPKITPSNVTAYNSNTENQLSSVKSPGGRFDDLQKNHSALADWLRFHALQMQDNGMEVRAYVKKIAKSSGK
jgi:hypothetical protein